MFLILQSMCCNQLCVSGSDRHGDFIIFFRTFMHDTLVIDVFELWYSNDIKSISYYERTFLWFSIN